MACFKALGFHEMPGSREEITARYEQRRQAGAESKTESERLAARLLTENYRACLRAFDESE